MCEKKTINVIEMYKCLVCGYKSQDFAQSQENFAWSHDHQTVTFRNSA